MRLIDTYYKPGDKDPYTFVFDGITPETGYYTMLAMSEDGWSFNHYTSGLYDPAGPNEHLGQRVAFHLLGAGVLDCFFSRIAVPDRYGREA
jgi:hypothetical protein